jgi:hypothetical protein
MVVFGPAENVAEKVLLAPAHLVSLVGPDVVAGVQGNVCTIITSPGTNLHLALVSGHEPGQKLVLPVPHEVNASVIVAELPQARD